MRPVDVHNVNGVPVEQPVTRSENNIGVSCANGRQKRSLSVGTATKRASRNNGIGGGGSGESPLRKRLRYATGKGVQPL